MDYDGNNLELYNEESFREEDYYNSYKEEDVELPEIANENLSAISQNISV